jgi:hypothetical protein
VNLAEITAHNAYRFDRLHPQHDPRDVAWRWSEWQNQRFLQLLSEENCAAFMRLAVPADRVAYLTPRSDLEPG